MAKFELKINCDNAAFDDEQLEFEVARILCNVADRVKLGDTTGKYQNIRDVNGNVVGTFKLTESEE